MFDRNPPQFNNLVEILTSACQCFPHRVAVIFGSKKITYREISDKAVLVASALNKWGIGKNTKVALLLDNSPEFVFCYFGILAAGGIIVPVNHMFKRDEIKYIIEDSGSRFLVTSSVYTQTAQELCAITTSLESVIYTNQICRQARSLKEILAEGVDKRIQINEESGCFLTPYLNRQDLAVFLYTSGTTGHPKAAMLTHENLLSNVYAASRTIRVRAKDTFLCFLPLFHSFAATVCMLMPFFIGAKVVIMKSPKPIRKLARAVLKNRVTIFVGIPSIYNIAKDIKLPRFLPRFLLRFLVPVRLAISGAAALPPQSFTKFEQKYGIPLLEGYGLTEASPVVSLNPLKGKRKAGSIGLPIAGVEVKIVDEAGRELKEDQIGELCVRGPNVMSGYFNKENETAETIKDGWLFTGDMAKKDNEGYLYIMGRKKEMVNVRGLNVYPREIEDILYQNTKIKEAAVIGIPDAHKGEVPIGFVVLKSGGAVTEREIITFLKERLASYKIPKRIEIRDELPKNASGKILKNLLSGTQWK